MFNTGIVIIKKKFKSRFLPQRAYSLNEEIVLILIQSRNISGTGPLSTIYKKTIIRNKDQI